MQRIPDRLSLSPVWSLSEPVISCVEEEKKKVSASRSTVGWNWNAATAMIRAVAQPVIQIQSQPSIVMATFCGLWPETRSFHQAFDEMRNWHSGNVTKYATNSFAPKKVSKKLNQTRYDAVQCLIAPHNRLAGLPFDRRRREVHSIASQSQH